ncbi:MAG: M48 family metalloprotease [Gammaproteobacteria bacterium]|nr:M48 family metalloprotease [Gammaproteobacteria bacterium]MDH5735492.1 M48 family metalloprotease [Gammaproteobacteria bacterium]
MGKNFYKTLKANVPFVDDLVINEYLDSLGQKLVSQTDKPDNNFKFFILKIPTINAFAGPDAYIGIHTGLILNADNESQLAGVLAHEISHVTQRHLARAMTESSVSPAAMFATMLAGILLSTQNPQAGAAVFYGGSAAMMQSQINFTRHNEHEADRIGIHLLRNAGINPVGMSDFFGKLLKNADSNNILAQMEYLRTHPLNSTRVAEAQNRIETNDKKLPDDSLDFQLSKARIIVTTASSLTELINHIEKLNINQQTIATRYTYAIALTRQGNTEKSITILNQLITSHDHPWFRLDLAKAYETNNQPDKALSVLENLLLLYPNYLPVTIEYARALNQLKQPEKAIQILKQQLKKKEQPVVFQALAQNYYANNQITAALEATSHQYELEGYLQLAAQQIDYALKQTDLESSTRQRLVSRKNNLINKLGKEQSFPN